MHENGSKEEEAFFAPTLRPLLIAALCLEVRQHNLREKNGSLF
jgi:hypothetical protein